ncbi:MAG: efflux RND transporter permease subunit [Prevotellaceae bacterium]|jgi:multidrug efflux pump subunit AcrB|nr:efflux RND transporter permease subunit [Prevotellaceae bacterium]
MIDFGEWGLKNRKPVGFFVLVLIAGGLFAIRNMGKLEDPEIIVKQALVITVYPGASAHQVEMEITDLLEKSIRTMKNIDHLESRSMNDLSMITVSISTLVSNREVDEMWTLLRRKVDDVQSALPEGAYASIVKDDFGDVMGMFYALSGDGFSDSELGDYAELLRRNILEIEGVSKVDIYGQRETCINIELYEDKMAYLGIAPAKVLSTLNGQNKTAYSGYYEAGSQRLRVTVSDKYRHVEDIENLLFRGYQGDRFRLKDIAKVSPGYETPARSGLSYDNQKALGIIISALTEADIVQVGEKVETCVKKIMDTRVPAGIEMHKVFFQPDRVSHALNHFMLDLMEAVVIVILLLFFFTGFRSGLLIATNLVVIVMGSILVLYFLGGTLQRVSLATFVLAMGILVDDAIVVLDNILVNMERGMPREKALATSGRKTALPLLGATAIAILAFFPIYLSPDTAGIYVRDLFIVLAVSLAMSWALALIYVPIQGTYMLRIRKDGAVKDPHDNRWYRALRAVLSWALHHKSLTLAGVALLLLSSLACYRFLPQGFFPDMDYDQLYMEYKLPEGTSSDKVKEDLHAITDYLLSRNEIRHVTASVGGTPARYNLVRSIADPSLSYGELIIDYASPRELVASMDEIQEYLTAQYPGAYVRLKRYNLMYRKYPIEVQFNGPDPAVLRELTGQAKAVMEESPSIFLVCSNWEAKTPVLMVDYNQPVARDLGIGRQEVALSLLSTTNGIPASVFYDNIHKQTIYLKCVDSEGNPVESLGNTPVFNLMPSLTSIDRDMLLGLMTGVYSEEDVLEEILRTVPLSQVSDGIKLVWADPLVVRYNGQRSMRAQGNPVSGTATEDARQSIVERIEAIALPEGYTMQWEGEYSASRQSSAYLFKYFPLAIVLMIAILIILFKDYRKPAIILCCIPLLFVGVIFGMLLSGKTFGFVAIVGILGLVGLMIRNGVLLIDEIVLQLREGVEPEKALLDSSANRFRPIMMVSLATSLGMIPLLSDKLFGPLAVTIMGGLLFGTLITLVFVPVLYALFFRIKIKK